jgi:hypothetical protein
LENSKN